MPPHAFSKQEWLLNLYLQAEELRQSLIGETPHDAFRVIKSHVDGAEIAFGVWSDASMPMGFGFNVIKGKGLLDDIATGRKGHRVEASIAAIPCSCVEQAIAASQVWGGLH